jgi:hypothetical protein
VGNASLPSSTAAGTSPDLDPDGPYIVIEGDPVAGFIFVGPFGSYAAAERWAEERDDTWTVSLQAPEHKDRQSGDCS